MAKKKSSLMQKLIGIKKNIAIFISGTGSNFKKLLEHSLKKESIPMIF